MKRALAVAVLLTGCAAAPSALDVETPSAPLTQPAVTPSPSLAKNEMAAERATVRIRVTTCTASRTGTGFHVGEGRIITNRHVIEDGSEITVTSWDGQDTAATAVHVGEGTDLAILQAEQPPADTIALSRQNPEAGQPVSVIGHPEGGKLATLRGTVQGTADGGSIGEESEILMLDSPVRPGNSGGPVIHSESGDVIGIVFAYQADSGHGLAISVINIMEALSRPASDIRQEAC